jgi:hypothetical protein
MLELRLSRNGMTEVMKRLEAVGLNMIFTTFNLENLVVQMIFGI